MVEEGDGGLWQECKLLRDRNLGSTPVRIRPTETHAGENQKP